VFNHNVTIRYKKRRVVDILHTSNANNEAATDQGS